MRRTLLASPLGAPCTAPPWGKLFAVDLAHGKIAWGRADIGDDPIVVVLAEKVSDAHLAGLRTVP